LSEDLSLFLLTGRRTLYDETKIGLAFPCADLTRLYLSVSEIFWEERVFRTPAFYR
jgi:hypothetical protein